MEDTSRIRYLHAGTEDMTDVLSRIKPSDMRRGEQNYTVSKVPEPRLYYGEKRPASFEEILKVEPDKKVALGYLKELIDKGLVKRVRDGRTLKIGYITLVD